MVDQQPVRCQKCGKPIGYVNVYAKNLFAADQPVRDVKIVAVCMNCRRTKFTVT